MRTKNISGAFAVITALLTITLGSGAAYAQGKGRGGDRGNPGGQQKQAERQQGQRQQPQQQQRNERPQVQRQQQQQPPQQRYERPQAQRQQQQQPQQQRYERQQIQRQQQQQRAERPQVQREQQRGRPQYQVPQPQQSYPNTGWQNQGRQDQGRQNNGRGRVEQQRSQPNYAPYQMRTGQRRSDRTPQRDIRVADQPRYRPQGSNDVGGYVQDRQQQVQSNNAWPNNYGYERSREVHARNADRKALRDENRYSGRDLGDQNWFAYRYTETPNYRYTPYAYQNYQRWTDVLRNVVANALGSNAGYYDSYYPQYQSMSYGDPYYQPYYGGNYYNGYPQYQSYAYNPGYYDNSGYGYGYDPQYYGDQYYPANYGDQYYAANYGSGYMPGNIVISFGSGYDRQMSSQLLAMGYDQGYNDGLYAASAGYGDRYYNDPYIYEDTMYDPYSYSLGENRRVLSNGYEIGYMDALNSRNRYDPNQYGHVSLVSVLIASALSLF